MSYSQALEMQISTLRWIDSAQGREWFDAANQTANDPSLKAEADQGGYSLHGWTEEIIDFRVRTPLDRGTTFYWDHDLAKSVLVASASLPDITLRQEMLPTRDGYVWFSRALNLQLENSASFPLAALSWVTLYDRQQRLNDPSPTVVVVPFMVMPFRPQGVPMGGGDWDIGERLEMVSEPTRGVALNRRLLGFFGAMLMFMQQSILIASARDADRHTRKRLAREGVVHEPLVRVVELRRKQTKSETHGDSDPVEWSHQWIVSGHWRQQWYPSLNANQPRWIMPYVKGPEDKPLKPPRAKVFAVVR